MENFLRGHAGAFAAWDGVPRVLLYDNLKSAVLERQGEAIRFNPGLIDFARCYRFEPRPVAVARGNEKACASYYTSCVGLVVIGTRRVGLPGPDLPMAMVWPAGISHRAET
jgi:hypothetical protein